MFGGHLPGAISESPRRVNQDRSEMLRKVFEHRLASAVSCHALHRSASRLTFQWESFKSPTQIWDTAPEQQRPEDGASGLPLQLFYSPVSLSGGKSPISMLEFSPEGWDRIWC